MRRAEHDVRVRWIYADPLADDGVRVLVDREWPDRMARATTHVDDWCRSVAPSTELSSWYGCDPARFEEFDRWYRVELTGPGQASALAHLCELVRDRTVTLLTAIRHVEVSEATILADLIAQRDGS